MRNISSYLLTACLAAPLAAQMEHVEKFEEREFSNSSGGRLDYRLFRPANYDPSKQYPLVVYLHGAGGRGDDNLKQLTGGNAWGTRLLSSEKVQRKHPSFVLAPQTNPSRGGSGWGGFGARTAAGRKFVPEPCGDPIDLVIAVIDLLGQEFSLDAERIYVTGQSMGGYGSWGAVTRYPDRFASAAPICGGGDPSAVERIRIPIWAFHGNADKTVPVEQSRMMIEALKASGAEPRYTEYPGVGHNSWEKAYSDPELVEWLFAQRKR